MKELNRKDHIAVNPLVCHVRPCIKGTRIWVSLVLDLLASGSTGDDIKREYPQLTSGDIQACIVYGAETTRERFVPVEIERKSEIQTG